MIDHPYKRGNPLWGIATLGTFAVLISLCYFERGREALHRADTVIRQTWCPTPEQRIIYPDLVITMPFDDMTEPPLTTSAVKPSEQLMRRLRDARAYLQADRITQADVGSARTIITDLIADLETGRVE